jgi:hypothetical protein
VRDAEQVDSSIVLDGTENAVICLQIRLVELLLLLRGNFLL